MNSKGEEIRLKQERLKAIDIAMDILGSIPAIVMEMGIIRAFRLQSCEGC